MFTVKTLFRDIIVFFVVGFVLSLLFEGGNPQFDLNFWNNVIYSSILCYFLATGNTWIFTTLDKQIPWIEQPVKRLVVQVLSHTIYSGLVILVLNIILLYFIYPSTYTEGYFYSHLKSNLFVGLIITIFVLLIIQGERFFENWKTSLVRAERLEKEKALTQYQALRSQVNPHFLFNSLNTLSGLIHQDPDLADKYVAKLSEVYRYVLANQESEAVALEEELSFIRSYLYLLNIRYDGNVRYEIYYSGNTENYFIIPLGLQILIENAIKHNRISEKKPLVIEIRVNEKEITIKNDKRPRLNQEPSTGKGLSNLIRRYEILTTQKVKIEETETTFSVQIPLLIHEGSNY